MGGLIFSLISNRAHTPQCLYDTFNDISSRTCFAIQCQRYRLFSISTDPFFLITIIYPHLTFTSSLVRSVHVAHSNVTLYTSEMFTHWRLTSTRNTYFNL